MKEEPGPADTIPIPQECITPQGSYCLKPRTTASAADKT